ncbi:MAG: hypothetical protein ACI9MR_003830, partial [Myxococcota bacterium]
GAGAAAGSLVGGAAWSDGDTGAVGQPAIAFQAKTRAKATKGRVDIMPFSRSCNHCGRLYSRYHRT